MLAGSCISSGASVIAVNTESSEFFRTAANERLPRAYSWRDERWVGEHPAMGWRTPCPLLIMVLK
jgi:hypothetical protein